VLNHVADQNCTAQMPGFIPVGTTNLSLLSPDRQTRQLSSDVKSPDPKDYRSGQGNRPVVHSHPAYVTLNSTLLNDHGRIQFWRLKMNTLIQAFSRLSDAASNVDTTWQVLTIFCLAGLLISLMCVNHGIDLTLGFVGP
jgi:hypothetical protein